MRRFYVSIAGVPDEFLEFLGYVRIEETDEFKVYLRHGELVVVKKTNPYLYVDDLNDARILKDRNMMEIPAVDGD
jgi:hypothetical protein